MPRPLKLGPHSRRASVFALAGLSLGLVAACSAAPPKTVKTPRPETKLHTPAVRPSLDGPDAPPLDAFPIGSMDSDESPAAIARRGTDAVVVYPRGGHLYGARVDLSGAPPETAPEKDQIDFGAIGAIGRSGVKLAATSTGYVLFWDEVVDQTTVFKLRVLDDKGQPVAATLSFAPVSDNLAYAGVIAFDGGLLVVHETEVDGAGSIHATPVDPGGTKILSPAKLIARGVLGWDFAAGAKEAQFAIVDAPISGTANEGQPLGPVRAFTVDANASKSAVVTIVDQDVSDIDVQVAPTDGGAIVAFTDHTDMEGAVKFAVVKGGALTVPPKRVSAPLGDAAFVEIVSAPRGTGKTALVCWENVGESGDETRVLHYASVGADGKVAPDVGSFLIDKRASPEIVADGDGWAMLTLAPSQLASEANAPPKEGEEQELPPVWPAYVRVGADLAVRASEPVRFYGTRTKEGVPDVTFSLGCDAGICSSLAAATATPAPIFIPVLAARESKWQPVAWKVDTSRHPAIRDARSLAIGDQLFHVTSTNLTGGGAMTAWTTYFVDGSTPTEEPPKGEAPYAATLGLRLTRDDGSLGDTIVLSKRAVSEGGVGIAELPSQSASKGRSDGVVVWVASEKTGPNLYATRFDADGKKSQQKKLTTLDRSKGKDEGTTATNVAIAFAPAPSDPAKKKGKDGGEALIVGWVDTRDKNGEVYVARVSKDLDKTVVDTRVTKSDGDAADVEILVRDNDVYVAYSDMREEGVGAADVYLARLDADTLKVKDDGRVYASGAHSHGPKLAMAGSQLMMAWIEDGPDPTTIAGASIRVAALDPTGRLVSAPFVVEAPKPAFAATTGVASFAFTCGATVDTCKISFSAEVDQGQVLFGLGLGKDGAPAVPVRIAYLSTAAMTDTSLSFADSSAKTLTFLEQANVGRARLVHLDW